MAENINENKEESEDVPIIGPALPLCFKKNIQEEESSKAKLSENRTMGPALPPHMLKETVKKEISSLEKQEECTVVGPELPPHLLKTKSEHYIGPELPPHLRQQLTENNSRTSDPEEEIENEVYGPLPPGEFNHSKAQVALEERALLLKMNQLEPNEDKAPVREEWMLELPEVKAASLGLGPRQFKTKIGPDFSDRSSWTDTPNKKAKKEEIDLKKEAEMKELQRRDKAQEKISKKLKKKNKESLLDLHQKEMKKKKKDEGGQGERRPFSRDIDLQVNRFDEAQKKAILKKAQHLDDRFSSGQSKFL